MKEAALAAWWSAVDGTLFPVDESDASAPPPACSPNARQLGRHRVSPEVSAAHSTEMCSAAYKGDLTRLTSLVRETGYDVNVGDYDKRTAIHLAASEGNLDVVKLLVNELGANPSPRDRWGGTPLNDALRQDHSPVIEFLKSVGATMGVQLVADGAPAPSGAQTRNRGRAMTRG